MKLVLAALALILAGGCTTYTTVREKEVAALHAQYAKELATFSDSWVKSGFDARECRANVKKEPGYPTIAEASTPGGMDRAAVKIERLTTDCMARKGYMPSV